MDEALLKSGQWPNIALTPGTNRHAATGEFVEIPTGARMDDGTRWHELFGTPERAAWTLIDCNGFGDCVDCPVCHDERGKTCEIPGDCVFIMRDYRNLLKWLEGDA